MFFALIFDMPFYHSDQKLEFLGDAVLEYLITSYLYSVFPELKPGQITDLRSITVNNNSFANVAVWRSLHKYLMKDARSLDEAINKFESFVLLSDLEKDLIEEPACPKVYPLHCRLFIYYVYSIWLMLSLLVFIYHNNLNSLNRKDLHLL